MPKFQEPAEFVRGIRGSLLLKNIQGGEGDQNLTYIGECMVYQSAANIWYTFGQGGSFNTGSHFGGTSWVAVNNINNFNAFCALQNVHLADGNTNLRIGGGSATNTTSKIYTSGNLGASWSAVAIGASDTLAVNNLGWDSNTGHIATLGTSIYQSPTGASGTYTQVQLSGSTFAKNGLTIRPAGSTLGVACNGTTTYYTSTNGTTWTTRAFPVSVKRIEWSRIRGVFVGLATNGDLYTSTTGTSFWNLLYTNTIGISNLVMFGDLFVASTSGADPSVFYSENGTTWTRIFRSIASSLNLHTAFRVGALYPHQLGLCANTTNATVPSHFLSMSG